MTKIEFTSAQSDIDFARMKMVKRIEAQSALLMCELSRVSAGAGSDGGLADAFANLWDTLNEAEGPADGRTFRILHYNNIAVAIRMGVSGWKAGHTDDFTRAEETILKGALRLIASRLSGNRTQVLFDCLSPERKQNPRKPCKRPHLRGRQRGHRSPQGAPSKALRLTAQSLKM